MKLTELHEKMLKVCFNISRDSNQFIRILKDYQPQTIKNNLTELFNYGYLKRKKTGKYYFYLISDRGRMLLLNHKEIVEEIVGSSSIDSQLMLDRFIK